MIQENPLSPDEAQRLALKYWEQGNVITSRHFEDRADERNVGFNDIQNCLEWGNVRKNPKFNKDYGDWNYVIDGEDLNG